MSLYEEAMKGLDREWLSNMFRFGCQVGMRLSELKALSWDDIDLEKGVVTLCRAYTSGHFKGLKHKNRDPLIEIPLFKDARAILEEQKKWTYELPSQNVEVIRKTGIQTESCRFVFQNQLKLEQSRYWTDQAFSKQWITVQEKVKSMKGQSKPFTIVRHTFASRLISTGASSYMVAKLLGHTSSKMVEEKYAAFFKQLGGDQTLALIQEKLDSLKLH